MKIQNKRELQQIALNHSSNIDFRIFLKNYSKAIFLLSYWCIIDAFQHYQLKKIDKYEYLTGEEILPSNGRQIIQLVKFMYSPSGKALEKQAKTTEDDGEK